MSGSCFPEPKSDCSGQEGKFEDGWDYYHPNDPSTHGTSAIDCCNQLAERSEAYFSFSKS